MNSALNFWAENDITYWNYNFDHMTIGKSKILAKLAKKYGLPVVIDFNLIARSVSDLAGIPCHEHKKGL